MQGLRWFQLQRWGRDGEPLGALRLSFAACDADARRQLYRQPLVDLQEATTQGVPSALKASLLPKTSIGRFHLLSAREQCCPFFQLKTTQRIPVDHRFLGVLQAPRTAHWCRRWMGRQLRSSCGRSGGSRAPPSSCPASLTSEYHARYPIARAGAHMRIHTELANVTELCSPSDQRNDAHAEHIYEGHELQDHNKNIC